MAFQLQHSTIPNDIIYHIICDGEVYIGQSTDGFRRIQRHCTDSFRHPEYFSNDGSYTIYEDMRANGLKETKIIYYVAPNYGLKDEDFYWFFSQFIPQNEVAKTWHPKKATQSQKRDAAEIMHILHEVLSGSYKIVNSSMGGQQGSYRYKADKDFIKVLTRTMSPWEAAAIINASDTSKKALIEMTNRVNEYLFTDKWTSIYTQAQNLTDLPTVDREGQPLKYAKLTWSEFITTVIIELLPAAITRQWYSHDLPTNSNSPLYKEISRFVFTKEAILLHYLNAAADDIDLTQAQLNLVHNTNAHLFTAELNLEPLVKYLSELIRNTVSILEKRKEYSAAAAASKTADFTGVIRITSLFDISRLHIRGYNTEHISNLKFSDRHTVGRNVMIGFSFSNFQYIYNRCEKMDYAISNIQYIEWNVDDGNGIAIHNTPWTTEDSPAYPMSGNKIETRLTDRLKRYFLNLNITWPIHVWDIYMRDMMSIYRIYNIPDVTLDYYLVSNGKDVWLTSDQNPVIRIYWGDVYHQAESAKQLQDIHFY